MLRHRLTRSFRFLYAKACWGWRRAYLGDTRASAEARFGPAVKIWSEEHSYYPEYQYAWGEFSVTVSFRNDLAAMVWVQSDGRIPPEAREAFFDLYATGHMWQERPDLPRRITSLFAYIPDARGNRYWERSDRCAWACSASSGTLDDLKFNLDFTCSAWQEVKNSRFGTWFVKSERNSGVTAA